MSFGQDDGEPGLDPGLREFKSFHRVADPTVQAHADAAGSDHVAPVAEHLEGHLAGGDEEEDFLVRVSLGDLEHLFPDVVDRGDEEREDVSPVKGHGVDGLADEALAADGVFRIVDALRGKPAGGALEGFVAVGESDDEQDLFFLQKGLKVFDALDPVEEKIALARVGAFFEGRFYPAAGIFERMLEKIAGKDPFWIVGKKVLDAFPLQPLCGVFGHPGHSGEDGEGLDRLALAQKSAFLVPGFFCSLPGSGVVPNF